MVPRFSTSLWAVCLLVCTGLAFACDWDKSADPDQGLNLFNLEHGALLDQDWRVLDPDSCRNACCNASDCDLVLVDTQADGTSKCLLVRCVIGGRFVCAPGPKQPFKVYRKLMARIQAGTEKKSRLSPLIGAVPRVQEPAGSEENNVRCRLPMKIGPCRASFPKFYYEPTNKSCQSFTYGGCQANGNMFDSQEECENVCNGVEGPVLPDESTAAPPPFPDQTTRLLPALNTSDVKLDASQRAGSSGDLYEENCGAEPKVGHCRAAFPRWYYSRQTGTCQRFTYGGCGGNKNNYLNKESCLAACTVSVLPSSQKRGDDEVSSEYTAMCTVTPDPGPCRAAFPMFYYDPNTATCRSFIYGGCRGNQNRYSSQEECVNRCSSQIRPEGRGNPRNRWTAAVFLFVTLASISALLLGTLIIMTLRRHRLPCQPSNTSDKEVLLPSDSSSLESLSVPQSPEPTRA
ncbi:kunitz-type protease inhibitor 2 [Halichoeres trimaculatus]|uniref:kunitz-type protease inhibitor 2 n=1 Tax=Halichoeres trimaculatus TaxID=147232 RepID=UPI003D9E2187